MRRLLYYIYYRASKFYREWNIAITGKDNDISGIALLGFAICINILTLIGLLCIMLKIKYNSIVIFDVGIPIAILLCFFVFNDKKYKELEAKYKNEKN